MSVIGRGACLHLPLRASFTRASGVELLRDGNMEEATAAAWAAVAGATVAKSAVNPYAGTQCLVVTNTGAGWGYTTQTIVVVGRTYRARGAAAGDGAAVPRILSNIGTVYWTGTASALWQPFDVTFVADNATTGFGNNGGGVGSTTRWDMLSIQKVMMCTLDIGDYTSQYSYLLSDRGGATECAGLRKLDVIDRHTGARTTLADFSASPGAGAVYTLPSGWTYSCATAGRTTQTSAATLVTGIAANAAPAKSVDGVSFKVDVECARTNEITNCLPWDGTLAGWGPGGALIRVGVAADPAGGVNAGHFVTLAPNSFSCYATLTTTANSVFSTWAKLEVQGGGPLELHTNTAPTTLLAACPTIPLNVWARYGVYSAATRYTLYIYQPTFSGATYYVYGLQSEVGKYPSSLIPTAGAAITRATATLAAPHDQVAFDSGRIPELIWVPDFAYNETLLDAVILDDSRGRLYYCQADQKFTFTMYGRGTIKSLACTFSREQAVTLRADLDDSTQLATLIVSGCTTGDGTFQTYFNAEKAVQCGDGYTAASFPTQLVPRGMTTSATRYLRRNEPWGNSGACTIVFFMTRDSDAVQYVIDFRGFLGAPATGVALYNGGLVVSGGTGYVNGVAGAAWPRYLPSSLAIVGMPITSGGVSGAYYDISYPATGYVGRVYSVMIFPYTLTPTELADLHARAQWECNT